MRKGATAGRWPAVLVATVVVALVVAAAVTLAVDVHDVFGLRGRLAGSGLEVTYLYFHIYREGGPVEIAQWSLLATLIIAAGFRAGALRATDQVAVRFWLAVAVLGGLMLMEDAGNVRHYLADIGVHMLPMSDPIARTLVEGAFYVLVASPALLAVWLYRYVGPAHRPPLRFAIPGFLAYFTASVASASRVLGDWYMAAGYWVQANVIGDLPPLPDGVRWGMDGSDVTAFMVMDLMFEESIELLGAVLLLAACLAVGVPTLGRRMSPSGSARCGPGDAGRRASRQRFRRN